jgi:hypothetical protein
MTPARPKIRIAQTKAERFRLAGRGPGETGVPNVTNAG